MGSQSNKSARSGRSPSVRHQVVLRAGSTRDAAKETAQHTANILVQRRSHMSATKNCINDGASRALACANCCMVCTASSLHLPPVSIAITTSLHRPEEASSGYVASLSWRACNRTAPSWSAACGWASPLQLSALRNVMSTANCAPAKHRPRTS